MSAFADDDLESRQTATGLISAVQQRLNQRPVSESVEAASNVAYWVKSAATSGAVCVAATGQSRVSTCLAGEVSPLREP